MADIDIEKKSGGSKAWIWIIVILAILAIIYFWFFAGEENVEEPIDDAEIEQVESSALEENDPGTVYYWKDESEDSPDLNKAFA